MNFLNFFLFAASLFFAALLKDTIQDLIAIA
jgi:hypothetical protein